MSSRFMILLCGFLCASVTPLAAQRPNDRIDLDVVSNSPVSIIVIARISFAERDSQCPQDRGTLRISSGELGWIQSSAARPNGSATIAPIDDETQQYRIAARDCQTDIAVREQVRRDGSWVSLLVPKQQRPVCCRKSAASSSDNLWRSCARQKNQRPPIETWLIAGKKP
jgi:hypothetical protein